jgi:hypothetical protein
MTKRYPRYAVEERDGKFFEEALHDELTRRLIRSGDRLHRASLPRAFRERLASDRQLRHAAYFCLFVRCSRCGAWFYGPARAQLCSTCLKGDPERLKALNPRRTAKRLAARSGIVCERCGDPISGVRRSTRRFCSNACRQAAHRSKASVA